MSLNRTVQIRYLFSVFVLFVGQFCVASDGDVKKPEAVGSKKGVIKLPQNVPGWTSGKVKNIKDIEYDLGGKGSGDNGSDSMAKDVNQQALKNLSAWRELLSFRPSTSIQKEVQSIGESWTIHRVEDGWWDVNLDYYPVIVDQLPTIGGKRMSEEELLTHS
jgi:hypothetical protein